MTLKVKNNFDNTKIMKNNILIDCIKFKLICKTIAKKINSTPLSIMMEILKKISENYKLPLANQEQHSSQNLHAKSRVACILGESFFEECWAIKQFEAMLSQLIKRDNFTEKKLMADIEIIIFERYWCL